VLSAVDTTHRMLALPPEEAVAWSYLSKSSALSAATLVSVLTADAGTLSLDRRMMQRRRPRRDSPVDSLTERQREVLALLAAGLTNAAIAETLGIAVRSVDNHVNAVYDALGVAAGARINPRVKAALLFVEHTR